MKKFTLSPAYEDLRSSCNEKSIFHCDPPNIDGVTVLTAPFNAFYGKEFFSIPADVSGSLLKYLLSNDEIYTRKSMDLYDFDQTALDLSEYKEDSVEQVVNTFKTEVSQWLRDVTKLDLNEDVRLFAAKYKYNDYLLCHDDELAERRIAFIWYLCRDWTEADGGQLQLFDCDGHEPTTAACCFTPDWNSFAFFEVTPKSFHQVNEVLARVKSRITISGWFHGASIQRPATPQRAALPTRSPTDVEESVLFDSLNPLFIAPEVQKSIQSSFEDESNIRLDDFLQEEAHEKVLAEMRETKSWKLTGAASKARYYELQIEDLTESSTILKIFNLFASEAFTLVLAQLTDLSLHSLLKKDILDEPQAKVAKIQGHHNDSDKQASSSSTGAANSQGEVNSSQDSNRRNTSPGISNGTQTRPSQTQTRLRGCVRRFERGCYTLLHDTVALERQNWLDVSLILTEAREWDEKAGGTSHFVADDEELLETSVKDNTVSLVYREPGTMRFTKYLNDRARDMCFYEFSFQYFEPPESIDD